MEGESQRQGLEERTIPKYQATPFVLRTGWGSTRWWQSSHVVTKVQTRFLSFTDMWSFQANLLLSWRASRRISHSHTSFLTEASVWFGCLIRFLSQTSIYGTSRHWAILSYLLSQVMKKCFEQIRTWLTEGIINNSNVSLFYWMSTFFFIIFS